MTTLQVKVRYVGTTYNIGSLYYDVVDCQGRVLFSKLWCTDYPTWVLEVIHKATTILGFDKVSELKCRNHYEYVGRLRTAMSQHYKQSNE